MTKKHKAKGGGHQQKPHKRKSPHNKFSRESSGAPSFSMRDEVMNTDRHHSEWSPSIRLRHQAMTFVSAGNMNPLEEAQIHEAEKDAKVQASQTVSERMVSDLEKSSGALEKMHIESSAGSISPVEAQQAGMELNTAQNTAFQTPEEDTPSNDVSDAAVAPTQDLFVIDTIGDQSLAPPVSAPVYRQSSFVDQGDSDEEVLVFRGRTNRVVIKDDPPAQVKLSLNATAEAQPQIPTSPSDALSTSEHVHGPKTTTQMASANPPTTKELRTSGTDSRSALTAPKAVRAELKKQKKRRPKKQRLNDFDGQLPRASFGMIMDDPDMMDDEDEDALLEDYIANMSGGDELRAAIQHSDSDWVSSVLDESEQIDDEIEPTSGLGREDGKARRKKSKRPATNSIPTTDVDMTDFSAIPSNLEDDDDDDDEADDDTSDPGDDSELESDLSYTARERWEDEADLRQRQIDAMTDEEIARMLAKQEELGMGSDELLLLDDSGMAATELAEAEAGLEALLSRSSRRTPKRGKKGRDVFPSASLMADVLDQDPYNGFDIMDFDRPSLRAAGKKGRKTKGPLPEELAALSDEDLISDLQSAWSNDRAKKAAKKAEREELRAEGLLGRGKANKFRPDPQIKFAEGLTLNQLRHELEDFLDEDDAQQKAFPPMEKGERQMLHRIANIFDLSSNSRGSGKSRFTILSKRARTGEFDARKWSQVEKMTKRSFLKGTGKGRGGAPPPPRAGRGGGFSSAAVGYRNGEVVGAAAPEIAEGNFGRKLMEKMGWERGMALGKGGDGLLLPVEARVKSGRGGLG
ncbi:Protein SQS1 [Sphaceloma murrayae]|uniref:Protein SQS1 n=1 Tax=Sphaceloma murrayae TaxID=2082308 RepID=A0A2K1R2A5_9PEZI|nr:Protein SQS1 [Sphaceloma murrayae]